MIEPGADSDSDSSEDVPWNEINYPFGITTIFIDSAEGLLDCYSDYCWQQKKIYIYEITFSFQINKECIQTEYKTNIKKHLSLNIIDPDKNFGGIYISSLILIAWKKPINFHSSYAT